MFKRIVCLRTASVTSFHRLRAMPPLRLTTRLCSDSGSPKPAFEDLLVSLDRDSKDLPDPVKKDEDVQQTKEKKLETLSSVCVYLHQNGIEFDIHKFTKNVQTTCPVCLSPKCLTISRFNETIVCRVCDYSGSFMDYKNEVYLRQERGTFPRPKRSVGFVEPDESSYQLTLPSGSTVYVPSSSSAPPSKSGPPAMSNYDDLDTDLYDRVSYLNLMSQQEERERKRKLDQYESMRRLREEADKLSARGEPANDDSSPSNAVAQAPSVAPVTTQVDPMIRSIWNEAIDLTEMRDMEDQTIFLSLRMLLGVDRISLDTLSRFHIKGHLDSYDNAALCYPRYRGPSGRTRPPSGLKIIRKVGEQMEKENYPQADDFGQTKFSGIFGYHMVTPSDKRIILTTNERDALAVYDSTGGMLTVALPKAERFDHAVLPFLEDFESIYLWFPIHHEKFAKDYASYLNSSRCFIIPKSERPIELVRDNREKEINRAIREEAVRVRNRGFRSMIDVRSDLRDEILHSNSKMLGLTQWKRFEALNKYMQGFRPGELTVLTGATGIGKTTFLCEYSLDLFVQGVRTLFCSFEMQEEKILKWMLVQYSGLPLYRVEHHPSVEMWLDRFERTKGDLIIMKVDEFRDKTINQIANAIRDQVVAAGIQHVVIDNLQFLIGLANLHNEQAGSMDRFNQQDRFVGLMRKMASDYGVHITLVVHPRKTESDTDLDICHFGGSARVTQEADNILAIQKRKMGEDGKLRKFLYILKNRHAGRTVQNDTLEMLFQRTTYTHIIQERK
uniref:SF4 helicase domain-containing protein n=1 Tax=Steinernema glaseri TaxID=37863 RepID=A0A1I8A8B9_9BILA